MTIQSNVPVITKDSRIVLIEECISGIIEKPGITMMESTIIFYNQAGAIQLARDRFKKNKEIVDKIMSL